MLRPIALLMLPFLAALPVMAQEADDPALPAILSLEDQARVRDAWLEARLDRIVPELMAREGVDMWLLIGREYNEDPVLATMLPATWLSARRRTILLFHRAPDGSVERLAVARYEVGSFKAAWKPEDQPDQWARLAEIVRARDPRTIAVNRSADFALADGLTASEAETLGAALGADLAGRLVSGEALAVGWLETRIEEELAVYPQIVRIAHAIVAEAFSERVITPGIATASEVSWWLRERVRELGLDTWFHPSVAIQRAEGADTSMTALFAHDNPRTIRPGDLLHVDFGIVYLGLATDTQHHGYVLRPGEREAPEGLRAGLAAANRLQDILTQEFRAGDSGNAILARTRTRAIAEGISPTVYTHPIGYHGHGAGGGIGMWDNQEHVPGQGNYPIRPMTAWSIELNAEHAVPEWGGMKVKFMLEEDAWFDGVEVRYIDGRQDRFHLIPRP